MTLQHILDPLFGPLLQSTGPFLTLLIVSLIVSIFTTLIYKYATNQERLKHLKADMKRYQNKLKTLKDNPEKAMKVQKDLMKLNGEFMKSSFKTTFYTIIPLLIFFGWLGANLAFLPLLPGEPFSISLTTQNNVSGSVSLILPENFTLLSNVSQQISNNSVEWKGVEGPVGTYELSVRHEPSGEEQFFPIIITKNYAYKEPLVSFDSDVFKQVHIGNKKLYMFKNIFFFKELPIIKNMGWLGAYIIFSLIFSMSLRKALKLA